MGRPRVGVYQYNLPAGGVRGKHQQSQLIRFSPPGYKFIAP
jgi:hypothetical protein